MKIYISLASISKIQEHAEERGLYQGDLNEPDEDAPNPELTEKAEEDRTNSPLVDVNDED